VRKPLRDQPSQKKACEFKAQEGRRLLLACVRAGARPCAAGVWRCWRRRCSLGGGRWHEAQMEMWRCGGTYAVRVGRIVPRVHHVVVEARVRLDPHDALRVARISVQHAEAVRLAAKTFTPHTPMRAGLYADCVPATHHVPCPAQRTHATGAAAQRHGAHSQRKIRT
jgi:hypothetical protein